MSVAPHDRIRLLVEEALRRPAHTRVLFLQTACGADSGRGRLGPSGPIRTTALRALFAHWIHLAQDDPASASRDTREAMQSWSQHGFHLPQLWELWSHAEVALYEGRGGDALELVQSRWSELLTLRALCRARPFH
jgi:hypothetical protein